jgi:protein-disulfide isomerase
MSFAQAAAIRHTPPKHEDAMPRLIALIAGCLLTLSVAAPVQAAEFNDAQKKEIEAILQDYLMANPVILRDMMTKLEQQQRDAEEKQRGEALVSNADQIYRTEGDPVVGNPKGDVTLVEFMDYNCSWCKRGVAELAALVEEDKNLKVIIKEFPIFGAGSEFAAKAAKAAFRQGKYWELHQALFKSEVPVNEEVTLALAESVGIDMAKLKADMADPVIAEDIAKTQALAVAMNISGTPAFIVDDKVFPGFVAGDQLAAAIGGVRATGGCKLC